ncbi:MAG: CDP-alcohol phosphatidyltransferase family protein [Treponema sp.]|nr:CDP-alcohol phosphatidyltransferase family protein [Treponema sp.]
MKAGRFSRERVPNALSLCRMALALLFAILLYDALSLQSVENILVVILFFAIIATDILDGFLARKFDCVSSLGARLDIIADAIYVIFSMAVFAYFNVVPFWFVIALVVKLVEFAITSRILRRGGNGAVFDKIGKAGIIAVMLLPGIFVFRFILGDYKTTMAVVVYALTLALAISFVSRIVKAFKSALR